MFAASRRAESEGASAGLSGVGGFTVGDDPTVGATLSVPASDVDDDDDVGGGLILAAFDAAVSADAAPTMLSTPPVLD